MSTTRQNFYKFACFACAVLPALAAAGELLPNGGFEVSDAQGRPVGWSLEPVHPSNVAERSERHAWSGRASLHLKCGPRGFPYCDAVSTRVPVEPGQRYVLTFRVHGSGNVFIHFYDSTGEEILPTPYYGFRGRRWAPVRIEFTVPKRAARLAVRFRVYPSKNEAWIDDVALSRVAPRERKVRLAVPNPSFEMVGSSGKPIGWVMEPGSPKNIAEATAEQAAHGRRSLHLRAADPERPYCDALSAPFPVCGSTLYTLSFDVKAPHGGRVFVHIYDAAGEEVGLRGAEAGKGFVFSNPGPGWKRVVVRFTPAPGARRMRLRFRVYPPAGEAWIDKVQVEEGEATPFEPGPPFQLRIVLPRGTFVRGEAVSPEVVLLNQSRNAATCTLRSSVEQDGRTLMILEKPIDLPPRGEVVVPMKVPTERLRCARYRLRASLCDRTGTLAEGLRELYIVPPLKRTIGYGFYGYRIEGCSDHTFPSPPFAPETIDRGLDLLASAHMNAFATPVRYPHDMFLYFLDGALRRGIEVIPLVGGYFGARADSPDDYALDAKGRKIFVHTSRDRPNLSFISPAARRAARRAMLDTLKQFLGHPAFSGHIYFGDDVAMWRGGPDIYRGPIQDYSPVALLAFKAKTGLDAPRRTAADLRRVRGILPDDDPWLLWMKFRCRDIFAGYMAEVIAAKNEVAPFAKAGSEHGGVWWPGVGAVPSYELKAMDLLTYYAYPSYPPYHLVLCEMAFLGGREKELWATPSAHNNIWGPKFEERTPQYERSSFFSILAGGAKAVTFCPFQTQPQWTEGHPAVWAEFRRLGEIVHRFGPFLYRLRKAPGRIGLLLSFSTSAYRVYDIMPQIAYEDTHSHSVVGAFFAMLRAQLPVELVDEEQLRAGEAKRYKAIMLADVQVLPRSVCDALAAYARSGGKVVLDDRCTVDIPGATRLSTHFYAHPYDNLTRGEIRAAAERARKTFQDIVGPILRCDTPDLAVREFWAGSARCLWLLNLRVDEPLTARVELPECGAAYDVFEGRRIERHTTLRFPPGGAKVVLLLPEPIAGVKLNVPDYAVQTEPFPIRLSLLDAAGKPVPGLQPAEVELLDPEGKARNEYAGYLVAEDGVLSLSPQFALNDPPGRWTVIARDLLSGREATASFTLRPALEVSLEPSGRTVGAKESTQHFRLLLKNNLSREITIRLAVRLPEGIAVSFDGVKFPLKLPARKSLRATMSCSASDPFYAGPIGGRLEIRFDGPYAMAVPVFFVLPPPAS